MIRGMHYMCWHERDWNYHPSMPMKRLQNIQDIVDMKGNLLLWSCLGSGAIGLPYLYREAFEQVAPRLRFYGHINDSEFTTICAEKGIQAFAVIWKSQLWEFPAEFNEDETELLSLNKLRGVGKRGWVGIRELSMDKYPKIFPSMKQFFSEGIRDCEGNLVEDYLEGFRVRTLEGKDVRSTWLMVPGHEHVCYTPCGNKTAYMQYLYKEIELMIDAGAPGILIDEFDTQLHALNNGGCFCKDCMLGFRNWLKEHPCKESEGLDLDTFDYGEYLRGLGYKDEDLCSSQGERRVSIPLFREFSNYQIHGSECNVRDISVYAKAYAKRTKNIENYPVTANLFNCMPVGASSRKWCDLICGETSDVKLRQDGFSRFAHAFMGGKPGSYIEDPSQHIFDMVKDIRAGKDDQYILFITESLAHGFNTAIPYGAWLMNFRQDTIYPPFETEKKLGPWLGEHEDLITGNLEANVALIYDQRYAYETHVFQDGFNDEHRNGGFSNFFKHAQELCEAHVLYNVIYVDADEPLTAERLQGYHTVLMPDCCMLTAPEQEVIHGFAKKGGRVAALGRISPEFYMYRRPYTKYQELVEWLLEEKMPVRVEGRQRYLSVSLQKTETGHALHLLNYDVNNKSREIEEIPEATFELGFACETATPYSCIDRNDVSAKLEGRKLTVKHLGVYTIIRLD